MELEVVTENTGSILHSQPETSCFVDDLQIGSGNLVVTSSEISWANDSGRGFKINYHWITVHAISKDLNSFPYPCIYMMTEGVSCNYMKQNGSEEDENADQSPDEDEKDIIEIRFAPSDVESLSAIYLAINQGSNLNPAEESVSDDGDDEFEPDYEEGQGDHAGGEAEHGSEEQDHSGGDQGQFDNADEAMEM